VISGKIGHFDIEIKRKSYARSEVYRFDPGSEVVRLILLRRNAAKFQPSKVAFDPPGTAREFGR
jgi:hypothetical protein